MFRTKSVFIHFFKYETIGKPLYVGIYLYISHLTNLRISNLIMQRTEDFTARKRIESYRHLIGYIY